MTPTLEPDWNPVPIPESAWKELAWWAAQTPKPQPPQMVPGLPGVNRQLMEAYQERLVAWKVGKAEAMLYGL